MLQDDKVERREKRKSLCSPAAERLTLGRERANSFHTSKQYFEEKTRHGGQGEEERTNTGLGAELSPAQQSDSSKGSCRNNLSRSVSKNSLLKIFKIK